LPFVKRNLIKLQSKFVAKLFYIFNIEILRSIWCIVKNVIYIYIFYFILRYNNVRVCVCTIFILTSFYLFFPFQKHSGALLSPSGQWPFHCHEHICKYLRWRRYRPSIGRSLDDVGGENNIFKPILLIFTNYRVNFIFITCIAQIFTLRNIMLLWNQLILSVRKCWNWRTYKYVLQYKIANLIKYS